MSAFANSAGGQIVYGIEEAGHLPVRIDEGIDPATVTKEWIEQVIDSNVQPRLEGLRIHPIPLDSGRTAYVVTIPQAMTYAPHQAPDNRYYYRQNFQSVPMDDYQIRDALRRETTPKPYVEFSFDQGATTGYPSDRSPEGEQLFKLHAFVSNKSNQPVFYTVVTLFISTTIRLVSQGSFHELAYYGDRFGNNYYALRKQYGIPGDFPIFREAKIPISTPPLTIGDDRTTQHDGSFPVGYEVVTPGHNGLEFGLIRCRYGRVSIDFPAEIS